MILKFNMLLLVFHPIRFSPVVFGVKHSVDEWVKQILAEKEGDPKDIYDEIDANLEKQGIVTPSTAKAQTS